MASFPIICGLPLCLFIPSCRLRFLCWVSFSSSLILLRPFPILGRLIEFSISTFSGRPIMFLQSSENQYFVVRVLINLDLSSYVSSQRWFRNTRRRLNNSIRRESRNETSENRRCYVPMTQTPLTPVFICDIPAPIRRILQLSQTNYAIGSLVTPSTGQLRHYRSESLTEEVTCAQMATPLGATTFKMAAKSSSVADLLGQTTCPDFEGKPGATEFTQYL